MLSIHQTCGCAPHRRTAQGSAPSSGVFIRMFPPNRKKRQDARQDKPQRDFIRKSGELGKTLAPPDLGAGGQIDREFTRFSDLYVYSSFIERCRWHVWETTRRVVSTQNIRPSIPVGLQAQICPSSVRRDRLRARELATLG
jgi:hypothetical protein